MELSAGAGNEMEQFPSDDEQSRLCDDEGERQMNVYTKSLGAAERGVSSELAAFLNYLQETTDYQLGQLSAGLEARGEDGAAQQASLEALSTALEVERQALAALTERVSTMETAMAALTKRVSTTESGIEDLEDRVRDLERA